MSAKCQCPASIFLLLPFHHIFKLNYLLTGTRNPSCAIWDVKPHAQGTLQADSNEFSSALRLFIFAHFMISWLLPLGSELSKRFKNLNLMQGGWRWEGIVFHAGYILRGVGAICFYKATAFHFCKQGCTGVFILA